jgi:UDP-N-acetylglucosamine 1-carboxyvinyltransferase
VIDQLRRVGAQVERADGGLEVRGPEQLRPTHITTLPYPGFPTDLQAQMMALLCRAPGISVVSERIFPDRFLHVAELNRMGANIHKEGPTAVIHGVEKLSGAPVMASDLRASAALVLAGLVAQGTTEVSRIYHLDRGYEKMEQKLSRLGAKIRRVLDKKLKVVRE